MTTSSPIVLVTGANRGIGLEVVRALANSDRPYQIIIGSRHLGNADNAVARIRAELPHSLSSLTTVQLDIASDESIGAAERYLAGIFDRIDIVVHNAGAGFDRKVDNGEVGLRAAFAETWNTNVAGTQVLTFAILPMLLKSSDPRLLFVTSGTSSLQDTSRFDYPPLAKLNTSPPAGWPKAKVRLPAGIAYRASKCGLNMLMREWTRILKNDGVKVWGISPGFLATGFAGFTPDEMREMGAQEASLGGHFIKEVVEGKRDADVGKIIKRDSIQAW